MTGFLALHDADLGGVERPGEARPLSAVPPRCARLGSLHALGRVPPCAWLGISLSPGQERSILPQASGVGSCGGDGAGKD